MARMAPRRRRAHHGPPARLIADPGALAAIVAIVALWCIGSVIAGEPDLEPTWPTVPATVHQHPAPLP